jgi:NADH-quinone oxidoreductase subunit L
MIDSWFIQHLWLVPLLPFLGFLGVGLSGRRLPKRAASFIAILAVGLSMVVGWGAALAYFSHGSGQTLVPWKYEWLRFSAVLAGNVGVLVDDISMLLVLVVTTISFLIHIYSQGYMADEAGYRRFFAFLNLFTCSMLGLVLSYSLLQMFVFWELVGLSSFLLIGYYWDKPSAVAACKKAFIVTRFADLGFLVGLMVLSYYGGDFDFPDLNSEETVARLRQATLPWLGMGVLPLSAMLVYCGAAGKSAMFPLHIWLPDAMEGPTPVSALIHAATMVVAGVYLVARMFPLFAASEAAMMVVRGVGAFTACFAALIAITQFDIKRVLAFSTLSQLGYMMLALGVASDLHPAGFTAAMFHLTTHACFKALLFLGAGSVIHAIHTGDLREMGGLRRQLPVTHATVLIACLAIAGIPPLSGFFSKDEILAAAWVSGHYVVFAVALGVGGLTAFYMFRLYFLAFWNGRSDVSRHRGAHESPFSMTSVLVVLAVPSGLLGFVPFAHWIHRGLAEHEGLNWGIAVVASAVGLAGLVLAFLLYVRPNLLPDRLAYAFGPAYHLVSRKFYVDEVYLFVTHRIVFRLLASPFNWFDRHCVDGFMDLTGQVCRRLGAWLRQTVNGHLQSYLLWVAGGALLLSVMVGNSQGFWTRWIGGVSLALIIAGFVRQGWLQGTRKSTPLKQIERD